MSTLKAIIKLYDYLGLNENSILDDIKNDFLTENDCRNGRSVIWYNDGSHEMAIYIDTLDILSDEEIEKELL